MTFESHVDDANEKWIFYSYRLSWTMAASLGGSGTDVDTGEWFHSANDDVLRKFQSILSRRLFVFDFSLTFSNLWYLLRSREVIANFFQWGWLEIDWVFFSQCSRFSSHFHHFRNSNSLVLIPSLHCRRCRNFHPLLIFLLRHFSSFLVVSSDVFLCSAQEYHKYGNLKSVWLSKEASCSREICKRKLDLKFLRFKWKFSANIKEVINVSRLGIILMETSEILEKVQ